jgi:hypothetical protein
MERSVIEERHRDIEEMLVPANQVLVEELHMLVIRQTSLYRFICK